MLTLANVIDAKIHGAKVLIYHEVVELIKSQDRVVGVKVYDHKTKQHKEYYAPVTVNAGGIWGHGIAAKAGVRVDMYPAKGSLLIFGHRVKTGKCRYSCSWRYYLSYRNNFNSCGF